MFRRLKAFYARYAAVHLTASLPGPEIRDNDQETVGYVDRISLGNGRLQVSGWVLARQVRLVMSGAEVEAEPVLRRTDVARALGVPETVGFDLTLPAGLVDLQTAEAPGLMFFALEGRPEIPSLPLPIRVPLRARLQALARFTRDVVLSVPAILGWFTRQDPACRARIKERMRLGIPLVSGALEPHLFRAPDDPPDKPVPRPRITIVLPVYNAFDLLDECLDRVARHTDLPWRLIAIDDGSPDPRVNPFLHQRLAALRTDGHDVTLLENPENLGFIRSVNRGLDVAMGRVPGDDRLTVPAPRADAGAQTTSATSGVQDPGAQDPDAPLSESVPDGPVVLLNTDAFVPEGWATRLVRPFLVHDDVATVTPMSNDAEIYTAPVICVRTVLRPGQGDAIDRVARSFASEALLSQAPTGVGFCMAMGRDWLDKVPHLDTAFGRGYGEEVDWCRKVARLGGTHLGLPGLFVEHRGGESFGSAEKRALVAKNNRIVGQRYPGYDQMVQDFIAADPMSTARLALGLAWAASLDEARPVPVYLAHAMGGGADHWLEHRMQGDLDAGRPSVVLRVGGPRRWRLELVTPMGRTHGATDRADVITGLLAVLPRRRVIYSCGVGDPDPVSLPEMLTALLGRPEDGAELLFHDFLPLSPSYTLLDSDGAYRGAPVVGQTADPAHRSRRPDGTWTDLADWQAAWRRFAERADLVVFSEASARDVRAVWPDLEDRLIVRPHEMPHAIPRVPQPAPDAPVVLAVLGNIGPQKGAGLLQTLGRRLGADPADPRLVLIGNIDPTYALPATVTVHGSYAVEDLPALTAQYRVTHWLIPSIWPETFCFTAREALATGLPVLAFDIGAQGEAVRAAANGHEMPFDVEADLAQTILTTLARCGGAQAPSRASLHAGAKTSNKKATS